MVSIIVATAHNGAIGRGGDQPFYIKDDLRRFKQLTTGNTIIMGRRTFEALPKGALPDRRNIVITRQEGYHAPRAEVVKSMEEALKVSDATDKELFIIGGGATYRQAMPFADRLYVTEIDADVPDADTFFPEIDTEAWIMTEHSSWTRDEKSGTDYRFVCYSRK